MVGRDGLGSGFHSRPGVGLDRDLDTKTDRWTDNHKKSSYNGPTSTRPMLVALCMPTCAIYANVCLAISILIKHESCLSVCLSVRVFRSQQKS